MTTYKQGIQNTLKSVFCRALNGSAAFGQRIGAVFPPAKGIAWLSQGLAGWVCDVPPDQYSPPSSAPFSGGQCPGVLYSVVCMGGLGYTEARDFRIFDTTLNVTGPIEKLQWDQNGNALTLNLYHNGTTQSLGGRTDTTPAPIRTSSIVSVTRVDGNPDDCGDPPSPPDDGSPITYPDEPISYDDENGNPVTDLEDVVLYEPYFDVDGDLNITVRIGQLFGDLEIFPDFRFSPRINWGGNGSSDDECGTPPDDPPEEDLPIVIEDEKPPIIGAIVVSESDGSESTTEVYQPESPSLYIPRVANVYFGAVLGSEFCWSAPVPIQVLRGYAPCPFPKGASSVRVSWSSGWSGSYSRVYEKPTDPDTVDDQPICV